MQEVLQRKIIRTDWMKGAALTFALAAAAKAVSGLPVLAILGQLVIALGLGMAYRSVFGVPETFAAGTVFSSKFLLRAGIVLLGLRLNFSHIYEAGWSLLFLSALHIIFAFTVVYYLARWFGAEKTTGFLAACGTAICGAAAIAAIAPQLKANHEQTAVSTAVIAVLGTIFTLVYTVFYSVLHLSPDQYGFFAGSTLHEVAHAVAAGAAGGQTAADNAILAKLTRVAFLVPAALLIGMVAGRRKEGADRKALLSAFPWFILGFLGMGGLNTIGIIPEEASRLLLSLAYFLIAMAMAALGLNVHFKAFRKLGLRVLLAVSAGSLLLAGLGYFLVRFAL
ncbi:putative sulfate exporter family transporter [Bacillus mangrovi]|uniref:Putative sulfate exporter family transporter n=1 Tax=Metabacillus mangrovi TaxID=1491830 RepID=A0A7X2V5D8_9BACI|nr:putative sulfate exporter family transporter [Metabacillus mangrovi]MTH54702.1 putative sulfate exporter family transporter [Metabacillus mangrovi]